MRYVVHFGPEVMHIELEGSFTFLDEPLFHKMQMALLERHGRDEVHLNLSRVSSIDATALRLLMMISDMSKREHCTLVFLHPQGDVQDALERAATCNALRIAA